MFTPTDINGGLPLQGTDVMSKSSWPPLSKSSLFFLNQKAAERESPIVHEESHESCSRSHSLSLCSLFIYSPPSIQLVTGHLWMKIEGRGGGAVSQERHKIKFKTHIITEFWHFALFVS